MRMRGLVVALPSAIFGLGAIGTVPAAAEVVDFEAFAPDTVLFEQIDGLRFPTLPRVFEPSVMTSSGTRGLSNSQPGEELNSQPLVIEFTEPQRFVAVKMGYETVSKLPIHASLSAFNAAGDLVNETGLISLGPGPVPISITLRVETTGSSIFRVEFAYSNAQTALPEIIDDLEFDAGGDCDFDGDIDLADFACLQICFGNQPLDCRCSSAVDLNRDAAIDVRDLFLFLEMAGDPVGAVDEFSRRLADAGPSQTVHPGERVMLIGTPTDCASGGMFRFHWTQKTGASVELFDAETDTASFVAPDEVGKLEFSLDITDITGHDDRATTFVNVVPESGVLLSQISLTPSEVVGGAMLTGTVAINRFPEESEGANATVLLNTETPSLVSVPIHVIVPAGANRADFAIHTNQTAGPQVVNIKASFDGNTQTAPLRILDIPAIKSVTQSRRELTSENPTSILTIELAQPAPPGGMSFRLESSSPALLPVPENLSIQGGEDAVSLRLLATPQTSKTVEVRLSPLFMGVARSQVVVLFDVLAPRPWCFPLFCRPGQHCEGGDHPRIDSIIPDVVTDGDEVCIYGEFAEGERVRIVLRSELDSTCIFCGCIKADVQETSGGEFSIERVCFRLGEEKPWPSGRYELRVLPEGDDCPSEPRVATPQEVLDGVDVCAQCPGDPCQSQSSLVLHVTPPYIVSSVESIDIVADAEDPVCGATPGEMTITAASVSGLPNIVKQFPVSWSAHFPSPSRTEENVGHFWTRDQFAMHAHLPIFVGRASEMDADECEEEAVVSSDPVAQEEQCNSRHGQVPAGFTGDFKISLSGVEEDRDDGHLFEAIAGGILTAAIAASAGVDLLGAAQLGYAVGQAIQEELKEVDDYLGVVGWQERWRLGNFGTGEWRIAPPEWPNGGGTGWSLTPLLGIPAGGDFGHLTLHGNHYTVGAPRVVYYRVELESVELLQNLDCYSDSANEMIIRAGATLIFEGKTQLGTLLERNPGSGWIPVGQQNGQFDVVTLDWAFQDEGFDFAPPRAPAIYVEIGIYEEDDGTDDVVARLTDLVFLDDFFGHSNSAVRFMTPGGMVREVKTTFDKFVEGSHLSDDCICRGPSNCPALANGFQCRTDLGNAVRLRYSIRAWMLEEP